jgi:hypothetical protein
MSNGSCHEKESDSEGCIPQVSVQLTFYKRNCVQKGCQGLGMDEGFDYKVPEQGNLGGLRNVLDLDRDVVTRFCAGIKTK